MTENRPRGILSPADRAYLRGEANLESEQSEYDARYRIRERIRHAMLDFELLFEHLSEQDRKQVFDPKPAHRDAFTEGLVSAIAFLYHGTATYEPPNDALFSEGIRRATERQHGDEASFCSVRIEVDRPSREQLQRIIDAVERGAYHELDETDLRSLACFLHRRERAPSDVLDRLKAALDEE